LRQIAFTRDGKALWWDGTAFEAEQREARREHIVRRFAGANRLDLDFLGHLDRDLREKLRGAGYATPSLVTSMKELFRQVIADANDRSAQAVESLVAEILEARLATAPESEQAGVRKLSD
jgi:hypothetical protein